MSNQEYSICELALIPVCIYYGNMVSKKWSYVFKIVLKRGIKQQD